MLRAIILVCGLLGWSISANSSETGAFDLAWKEVVSAFKTQIDSEAVVGASLYFIHDGETLGSEHFGYADWASKTAVDERTIYHWASVTKSFTAVALMQLVESGKVDLDDPVVKYLPELYKVHNLFGDMEEIRLRHLLNHTSGFRRPTWPWGGDEDWHPFEPTEWSQIVAMLPYTKILFEPGSRYDYSNPGMSIVGRIVEVVTGDDIEVYIDKNILKPLEMHHSYFDTTPRHLLKYRSNNYLVKEDVIEEGGLDFDTGITTANGGLNAPLTDMSKFLNFLLGSGDAEQYEVVLRRETLEFMFQPGPLVSKEEGVEEKMGMGFFVLQHMKDGEMPPNRFVGHTGSQKSFRTFIYIHPESRSAAIMATNTSPERDQRKLYSQTRLQMFDELFPVFFKKAP